MIALMMAARKPDGTPRHPENSLFHRLPKELVFLVIKFMEIEEECPSRCLCICRKHPCTLWYHLHFHHGTVHWVHNLEKKRNKLNFITKENKNTSNQNNSSSDLV